MNSPPKANKIDLEEGEVVLDGITKPKKPKNPKEKKKNLIEPKPQNPIIKLVKEKERNIINKNYEFVSSNYKSKPCEFFKKGGCHKGVECTFSHDFALEKINHLCKYFLGGSCFKSNCVFSHNLSEFPCKYYNVLGTCDSGTFCQFSHQEMNEEEINEFIKENEDFTKESLEKYGNIKIFHQFQNYLKEKNQREQQIQNPNFQLVPPGYNNIIPIDNNNQIFSNPPVPMMPLHQKINQNRFFSIPFSKPNNNKNNFLNYPPLITNNNMNNNSKNMNNNNNINYMNNNNNMNNNNPNNMNNNINNNMNTNNNISINNNIIQNINSPNNNMNNINNHNNMINYPNPYNSNHFTPKPINDYKNSFNFARGPPPPFNQSEKRPMPFYPSDRFSFHNTSNPPPSIQTATFPIYQEPQQNPYYPDRNFSLSKPPPQQQYWNEEAKIIHNSYENYHPSKPEPPSNQNIPYFKPINNNVIPEPTPNRMMFNNNKPTNEPISRQNLSYINRQHSLINNFKDSFFSPEKDSRNYGLENFSENQRRTTNNLNLNFNQHENKNVSLKKENNTVPNVTITKTDSLPQNKHEINERIKSTQSPSKLSIHKDKNNFERKVEEKRRNKMEKKIRKWSSSKNKNNRHSPTLLRKKSMLQETPKSHKSSEKIKSFNKVKEKFEKKQTKIVSCEENSFKPNEKILFRKSICDKSESENKFITQMNEILFGSKKKNFNDPIIHSKIAQNLENISLNKESANSIEPICKKELLNSLKSLFNDSEFPLF